MCYFITLPRKLTLRRKCAVCKVVSLPPALDSLKRLISDVNQHSKKAVQDHQENVSSGKSLMESVPNASDQDTEDVIKECLFILIYKEVHFPQNVQEPLFKEDNLKRKLTLD